MFTLRPLAFGLAFSLAASLVAAQTYPSQSETTVTDDADMLPPIAEAELAARLVAIEQSGNVDFAVVTLLGTALYTAGDDNDVFARGLIGQWDLGAANDGRAVLLLVFRDDNELVVEFGPGFNDSQTAPIQSIIDDSIVPAFRDDDYLKGLQEGVEAINTQIITAATSASDSTPAVSGTGGSEGGGTALYWIGGGIAAIAALIFGANRRAAAKLAATPCPSCGATGLTRRRVTVTEPTATTEGSGEVRTNCPACGHVETKVYSIPVRKPKEGAETSDKPGKGGSGSW